MSKPNPPKAVKRPKAYSYIRMSTKAQLKGRSLERQRERSAAYAAENDLDLVTDFKLEDIGVSAFKGRNAEFGNLRIFLNAVENGQIEKGSYLLVDSLDRLTRETVSKALNLLLSIIHTGITVVTLNEEEKEVYTEGKIDELQLIRSIIILSRSNMESKRKSDLIGDRWANKRAKAATQKLTKWCPPWLRLSEDRLRFEKILDRVRIVQSMFRDSANGLGNFVITRKLNRDAVPTFNDSNGWHGSYVARILNNRAAIGEFQPHKLKDGHRVPAGEPIKDYYPPIIPAELFNRAQAGRAQRLSVGRGRKGEFYSNLFSGLAFCGYCKSSMKFINKGFGPKGGRYLACDSAERGMDCSRIGWNYDKFETSFLALVQQIDLQSLLSDDAKSESSASLNDQIQALHGELQSLTLLQERAFAAYVRTGADDDFLLSKFEMLKQQSQRLEAELKSKQAALSNIKSQTVSFEQGKEEIKELIGGLQNRKDKKLLIRRAAVAARLRALIELIYIWPVGSTPIVRRMIEDEKQAERPNTRHLKKLEDSLTGPATGQRFFSVLFRDGTTQNAAPDPNNPMAFINQLFSEGGRNRKIDSDGSEVELNDDKQLSNLVNRIL